MFEAFRRAGSDLQPLEEGPNGFLCSEGERIVLRTLTEDLPEVRLCGEKLPQTRLVRAEGGFEAEFERLIDMWAGRSTFILEAAAHVETLRLDIGPHQRKLSHGAWDALIHELGRISASLPWGLSPGEATGRMTGDALANVHPAIIEHQLPIFSRLIGQLLADPPTSTLRIRAVKPLDLGRRIDLRTIRWLSRRPLELAGVRGLAPEDQAPDSRALADQPEAITSLDHPVTRYILHLIERIRRRLTATAVTLKQPRKHGVPDEALTAYARQLAVQVDAAAARVEALQRAPLFRALRPEPLSDAVLQSLPDHPLYSALHQVGRRLAEPGLAYSPGHDLYSSLKHSYDLFELVILYRLLAGIGANLPTGWRVARRDRVTRLPLEDRPADGSLWTWEGPTGHRLELRYQAVFRPPPKRRPLTSLSVQGVPDYILVYRGEPEALFWILLDAKYRAGRQSIHQGLGDIHRYRDSLRVHGRPADAAYIIVPALDEAARLYAQPSYLRAHRFGALVADGEDWIETITDWVQQCARGGSPV